MTPIKAILKDCQLIMLTYNKSWNLNNVILTTSLPHHTESVFWKPPAVGKVWVTSHLQAAVLRLYSWWTGHEPPLTPSKHIYSHTQRVCLPSNRVTFVTVPAQVQFQLHQPASESDNIIYKSCLSSCDHETAQLYLTVQDEFRWFLPLFFIFQTEELKLKAVDSENCDDDLVCTGYTVWNAVKFKFNSRQLHTACTCATPI